MEHGRYRQSKGKPPVSGGAVVMVQVAAAVPLALSVWTENQSIQEGYTLSLLLKLAAVLASTDNGGKSEVPFSNAVEEGVSWVVLRYRSDWERGKDQEWKVFQNGVSGRKKTLAG